MKYYCIGIKGAGMSTLASILFDLGNEVSGYDDYQGEKYTMEGLKKRGINIFYDNNHLIDEDTIVTYSASFSEEHPEIQRVKQLGLKIKPYHELLGDISSMFKTISVCGTHGKTTTSTMISKVLTDTIGCNYFIGDGSGYARRENELFVLESCEYKKHFLSYNPTYTILTNIELEHTECYSGIDEIIKTFNDFCDKTKDTIIACGDDLNIRKIVTDKKIIYYGFSENNDIYATNVKMMASGSEFDVYIDNKLFGSFSLPLFGEHMVLNALACITICKLNNISYNDIHNSLNNFVNAKRRFKEIVIDNTIIIDDYAHHPTEIKVTIDSARQKYPTKNIIAVFLPNTYSRTEALMNDFIEALSLADKSYVMDIECDREKQSDYPLASSNNIISKLNNGEKVSIETCDKLLQHKENVICFMSCAGIYKIEETFIELLKQSL